MSKLNTINDIVSKAIDDNVIDQTEFRLVLNEHEHYIELRNNLRHKVSSPALEDLEGFFRTRKTTWQEGSAERAPREVGIVNNYYYYGTATSIIPSAPPAYE